MKILITGSEGFIGKNLVQELYNRGYKDIYLFDKSNAFSDLEKLTADCDFVFHLAGVNRPKNEDEFFQGNFGLTFDLLKNLKKNNNKCPIMISSSIQAALDNPYGQSKKAGEDLIFQYSKENNVPVYVYRFPNVYGKWSRPNYNSVIATFCNNIANDLPIKVNDPNVIMRLVYIDDVVKELINCMLGLPNRDGIYCKVPTEDEVKLGDIATLIESFKLSRENKSVPKLDSHFEKCLYSTYLSFLPTDKFAYPLKMNIDSRGSFTEIIKTIDRGQFSVNISKPGITKGNHWHNTKNEKFLVVSGHCLIKFRKVGESEVYTYDVNSDKLEVVDIPCGYTHNITNIGDSDSVTFMWCNECFDPDNPDTYFLEV